MNGLSDDQANLSEEELSLLVREACIASNAHGFIEKLQHVSGQAYASLHA